MGLGAYFRLVRAGFVLAREGALSIVDPAMLPGPLGGLVRLGRLIERGSVRRTGKLERLSRALTRLGPTYVKLGQTLATRPDIVGLSLSAELAGLQDAMPPFDAALVPGLLEDALGPQARALVELSPPIAAASIAQVHRAVLVEEDGTRRDVAVKLLRPGIREQFAADLDSFAKGARLGEALFPSLRRLRPVAVVDTLKRSAALELDLRLEAASISEMAENIKDDRGFVLPEVCWGQTAASVLTTNFITGIPIRDHAALEVAGLDRKRLAQALMQAFLRHAIRDGFFHADMHPGNLFALRNGDIAAVDFGIMGRLGPREQRFLADVLYGFIAKDYRRIAERHFEIGYVPKSQSMEDFALALRAIGEPLHGRSVRDISMAKVLGQLFQTTELFAMRTRPELVLLQKNMVLVEGVARALDPELDLFTTAEPVVGDWLRREVGPIGRIEDARSTLERFLGAANQVPELVDRAQALMARSEEHEAARQRRAPLARAMQWLALLALLLLLVVLVGTIL